jgi:glycosyltransferase involved in cell wall biosynthesis
VNILVLILQTIRPASNHGGSSKVVKDVCAELARHGHDVTLLCGATTDNSVSYELVNGVIVKPELPYRQAWQDTWLVPPADLSRIMMTVATHAASADRLLVFDSHFMYPDVFPTGLPVVWSLRDFVYVQALQGSMAFRRDLLITPSNYVRDAYCDAVSGWLPGIRDRVVTVRNGIDLDRYSPCDSSGVRARLGVGDAPMLLFPHRPEEAKGLSAALHLCRRLATGQVPEVRLLILRGTDVAIMPQVRAFYDRLGEEVARLGISDNVILHDWIEPDQMAEVYAASSVTLCLGDIVEACSNTALESMACGTPVVASDIACYREFPDHVRKIRVGDSDAAERAVLDLLSGADVLDVDGARCALRRGFGYAEMLSGFRRAVEETTVRPALVPEAQRLNSVRIPAWISVQGGLLYDEYRKGFVSSPVVDEIWSKYGRDPFDWHDGMTESAMLDLVRSGVLVAAGKR